MAAQESAEIGIEVRLSLQMRLLVDTWTARNALEPAERVAPSPAIWLDLAAVWTSPEQVSPLRDAVKSADPRAVAALADIEEALESALAPLLQRITALRLAPGGPARSGLERLAGATAAAAGRLPEFAQALAQAGVALHQLGRDPAAIEAYRGALEALPVPGNEDFLGRTHELLGDALDAVLKFEQARDHYGIAASLTGDSGRRAQILRKRANQWIQLGHYRRAVSELTTQIDALRARGMSGIELGRTLDMAAQPLLEQGDHDAALAMIREAREHLPASALADLAVNFQLEADALIGAGRGAAAGAAIERAWDLALSGARGRIDPTHYRQGFKAALAASLPPQDEAFQLYVQGVRAGEAGEDAGAFAKWQRAATLAYQRRDYRLWLCVQANVAAFFSRRGDTEQTINIGVSTRNQARERGLARPELMSLGTLAALAATGGEVPGAEGVLALYARAVVLFDMHTAMMSEFDLSPLDRSLETGDSGQLDNELALLFQRHGSQARAAEFFRRAIAKARALKSERALVNRLCGLVSQLDAQAATDERRAAVLEIRALSGSPTMQPRGRIVALRTLAREDGRTDHAAEIARLSSVCGVMKEYRRTLPVEVRADYDRDFSDVPRRLAALLRRDGRVGEAFDCLQLVKGRRVIDARVVRAGDPTDARDEPLSGRELHALLPRAGTNTRVVDLMIEDDQGALTIVAYLVDGEQVRVVTVAGDRSAFAALDRCDATEREARLVSMCLESAALRELAEQIVAAVPKDSNLLVVPDGVLHQLPLHAIPVRGRSWTDVTPITYTPTAALLRFGHTTLPRAPALIAGDSHRDLAGAAAECIDIGRALGVAPLLGEDCTRAAIEGALRDGGPGIVHLAVHGRADARFGSRAALLVADGAGGIEWLEFGVLKTLPWSARLVVFSGCSTGAVGLIHGTQLASVAAAALETGVGTVVASLWPVNDQYARTFMETFYAGLVAARGRGGAVDLRPLLAEARNRVRGVLHGAPQSNRRDGRQLGDADGPDGQVPGSPAPAAYGADVAAALGWAPFCVFGAPLVEFA